MFFLKKVVLLKLNYFFSKVSLKKYNVLFSYHELTTVLYNRNKQYQYFHNFFWHLSPKWIKNHRNFFKKENRGFGEDAFHAMWYYIFFIFRPTNILEIGVYRGQTLSLFMLISTKFKLNAEIHGISPFSSSGDSVSKYHNNINYYEDVLNNFKFFYLKYPILHKGLSTDDSMIKIINSKMWDLIYIDGSHEYSVVKNDFDESIKNLKKGGLLILDDSSLYTDFNPPSYASAGHPGPSKVASEIDKDFFDEILFVGHNRVFLKKF